MTTTELIETLAEIILSIKTKNPIIVAFDGVDTSGKTTLANSVHARLQERQNDSIRISIDKFHNPKDRRLSKVEYSPEGLFYDSYNYEKLKELVLHPVKNGESSIINGVFDYRHDKTLKDNVVAINKNSIILLDGIFMNRNELF